jgi:hypothetical protein
MSICVEGVVMDTIVKLLAVTMLILVAVSVIAGPFMIGDDRKPFTARSYLMILAEAVVWVTVSGRVLGWW